MSDWLWGFLIGLINKGDKMRRGEWGFQWERRELPRGERDRFGKSGEGSESKGWELPWWPNGEDSVLSLLWFGVRSLVRELRFLQVAWCS